MVMTNTGHRPNRAARDAHAWNLTLTGEHTAMAVSMQSGVPLHVTGKMETIRKTLGEAAGDCRDFSEAEERHTSVMRNRFYADLLNRKALPKTTKKGRG